MNQTGNHLPAWSTRSPFSTLIRALIEGKPIRRCGATILPVWL